MIELSPSARRRLGVVTFRLYPEGGTRYVRVNVFPTRALMEKIVHPFNKDEPKSAQYDGVLTQGYCTGVEVIQVRKNKPQRRLGIVADVQLHRDRLGTEVVTHEFFHATIAYGRRIGFDWQRFDAADSVNADEERLSYVHSSLCREFVNRATKAGLYD